MKLLLNANIDPALAEELRNRGCDVVSIRDARPGAADDEVLKMAVADARILVTHDKDFGELAYHQGLPTDCGVILFRVQVTDFDRAVMTGRGVSPWSKSIASDGVCFRRIGLERNLLARIEPVRSFHNRDGLVYRSEFVADDAFLLLARAAPRTVIFCVEQSAPAWASSTALGAFRDRVGRTAFPPADRSLARASVVLKADRLEEIGNRTIHA